MAVHMAIAPAGAQMAPQGESLAAVEEGSHADVTGTPAFVINGRVVSGAQPIESFTRMIEDELAWAW